MFEAIQQEGVSIEKIEGDSLNSFLDNAEKAKDEEEDKDEENTEEENKEEDKEEEDKEDEEKDEKKSKDDKKDDNKDDKKSEKKSDKSKDKENLNDNPRFKQLYKQNKDNERLISSLQDSIKTLTKKLDEKLDNKDEEIPDWFKDDWGDDKEKWNEYQKRFGVSSNKQTSKEEEEKEQFEKAKQRIVSDLEDIEVENDIDLSQTKEGLKLRQEILKFAREEQILNVNGQYDIKKAYKFYVGLHGKSDDKKSDNVNKKKQIADKSLNSSKGGDDKKSKSFKVGSLRNVSWDDLI